MSPFSDQAEKQVCHLGERNLIENISDWLEDCGLPPPAGIGDDAAVIQANEDKLVITKDSLVYNKHFDDQAPPELVGAKLLKRNISDLAAMGATPSYAVIACLLPPSTSILWLEKLYSGLNSTANDHSISIVGGDLTSTFEDLAFTLTLLGPGPTKPLTRKTANPGDTLWVTGSLGGSIVSKHLKFDPRLEEGKWLAQFEGVSSAMDVSDGLAADLLNLCPENCRIELDSDAIPISEDAESLAIKTGSSAIKHALTDGEDYELLFTLDASVHPIEFIQDWKDSFQTPVSCIGKVTTRKSIEETTVQYRDSLKDFNERGYEHF
jgi:thiamine-monophosphate kinase